MSLQIDIVEIRYPSLSAGLARWLSRAFTPSVKTAVESQGYTADIVLDDFLNFDVRASRKEITEEQAR